MLACYCQLGVEVLVSYFASIGLRVYVWRGTPQYCWVGVGVPAPH